MASEPEPTLTVDELAAASESDKLLNEFENRHDAWARRGWARVDELCRWFADMGASFRCPEPPD